MKPRLKGSLVILAIVFALALPGAYGITINGIDNGGSYTAAVSASTGGAVSMNSIGSANPHFVGTDARKVGISKRWTAGGNTFSEVGFLLRNTQSYDATISGGSDKALKQTNALLILQAAADYIRAYGDSGTANLFKAGADLTVEHGSADVFISTNADGLAKQAYAFLGTNSDPGHDNIVTGATINGHAYYNGGTTKSSMGNVWTYVKDGSLTGTQNGYGLLAWSTASGSYARQGDDMDFSASGDYLKFTADAKNTVGGKNKEAKTSTEIYDGYLNNYLGYVSDNWAYVPAGMAHQGFSIAGTSATDGISIKNIYTESSKNLKIQAGQDAAVTGPGTLTGYQSNIVDPSVIQTVSDAYAGNPNDGAHVAFKGYYKQITGSLARQMYSETTVTNGDLKNFNGVSSNNVYAGEFGTKNTFTSAQGTDIYLDNKYTDNKKGYKEATVTASDPSNDLTGTITDAVGSASSDGTTQDVRVQGHTGGLDVTVDAYKYYNQHQTASAPASNPWYNYILGYVDDPVAEVGHYATGATGDTIQDALNTAPNINGVNNNLFLDTTTYSGPGNYDIVNNIAGGNNPVEKSFTLWGAGSYMKGAGNSVIDAQADATHQHRIFDLISGVHAQSFGFKNVNFNNGYTIGAGGAICIEPGGNAKTVTIENCNFNKNTAATSNGGAIYTVGPNTLHVTNSNFNSNTAGVNGGAIENDYGGITVVTGGKFTGNTAANGGAIRNFAASLTTTGVTFENNGADSGGAVSNTHGHNSGDDATYTSTKDTFTGNHATTYGGAIYLNNGCTVTVTNGAFNNNYAGVVPTYLGKGGAVLIDTTSGTGTASYTDPGTTYSGNLPTNGPQTI